MERTGIERVDDFMYLGVIIQENSGNEDEIKYRLKKPLAYAGLWKC